MSRLPLEGVRVADLTVVWSGPGATMLLGDLGAEVIRIEGLYRTSRQVSANLTRADLASRPYAANAYPQGEPGDRPYDRSAVFNCQARNKLSVTMCLETPEGRQAFLDLIAKSDVFVENNAKRVLGKLRIEPEQLREVNNRLIVARMPPLGLEGSKSDYIGYGPNFNALVGIQAMNGYEGEDPTTAGDNYQMDEASPAGLAFAVLAALWHRDITGQGSVIEFPQAENLMQEIGEYFLDYQMNRRTPKVLGNSDPVLWQDLFPTSDRDGWVAIAVRHDDDWEALGSVVGAVAWHELGRTAWGRKANADALKRGLAEWTKLRSAGEIVSRLQAKRVPAGQVMGELDLLEDTHLARRKWFCERTHPSVGTHCYPGHPWRAEGFDLAWGRPLPSFGEDNEYVYKEILGYTDERFDDLVDRGLVGSEQRA